jgi:tagaturonate reductase
MKLLNRQNIPSSSTRPVSILQFGTGNFLRGFADWMIDILNEKTSFNGDIQMVQVHSKKPAKGINSQEGLYHVLTKGIRKGETVEESRLIQSVRGAINPFLDYKAYLDLAKIPELRFVISNTTEAGIYFEEADKDWAVTPESFPGKLTALLYQRFQHFDGDPEKGLVIIPCELVEDNGKKLKENIKRYIDLWNLSGDFEDWVVKHNFFCNTLVDRIVPGYPLGSGNEIQAQLGFKDEQMVMTEPFYFWAIDGPEWLKKELPLDKAGFDVLFVKDIGPYRTRKVRILNGAHTCLVPVAYLKGIRLVKDAMENEGTSSYLKKVIFEEIIPAMDQPEENLIPFAEDVLDRFRNPFIKHNLSDIALNSISKWKVRVLPTLLDYINKKDQIPTGMVQAFAAMIVYYRGHYNGEATPIKDKPDVIKYFDQIWKIKTPEAVVESVLAKVEYWDQDLNLIYGLSEALIKEVKTLLAQEEG